MEIIDVIARNSEWIFSGIGVTAIFMIYKCFRVRKKDGIKIDVSGTDNQVNYGSSNNIQVINKNVYQKIEKQADNNQRKNTALLIEYIDRIINNLTKAEMDLKDFGVSDSDKWYDYIKNAIIDDKWKNYVEELDIPAKDIIKLKVWFQSVEWLREYVNKNQGLDINSMNKYIKNILNDNSIESIKEELKNSEKRGYGKI